MAQLLRPRGIEVQGLVLIDPPSPVDHIPLSMSLIDCLLHTDIKQHTSELRRLVKDHFSNSSDLLATYRATTASSSPNIVILRSSQGFQSDGLENVPHWLSDRSDHTKITSQWEQTSGASVRLIPIPGHHFEPFESHNVRPTFSGILPVPHQAWKIDDVTKCLVEALESLETT